LSTYNFRSIAVIGLGYVGFPLAVQAATNGYKVLGVDTNQETVRAVGEKRHFLHDSFVAERIEKCEIEATTNLISADAYIVCVPTPVTNFSDPDLSFVKGAVESIAEVLEDGQLVVIESTINPGVSEEVVAPILDQTGKKYSLAHCPERINPGDPKWTVANIPRVVGGIDEVSTEKAAALYRGIIDAEITELSQIAAAESTKILENTFRDVNIAFINEMAQSFHKLGIDVKEVVRGASTKPFGFMPHFPGIGVGGHCIAVDPYYMIERGKQVGFDHVFLKQARKINSEMPLFAVQKLQDGLNECSLPLKGTVVAVLGLSYKPNIRDDRESPAYTVIK
jgi:UDP-N-acetyl-D-glucosamine dehydrogenase